MNRLLIGAALLVASAVQGFAETPPPAPDVSALVGPELKQQIGTWLKTDIVRLSINAQNQRLGALTEAQILELDKQWRAERKAADKPLIAATLSNPLSVYLARMQGRSLGLFAEIFIMDRNGLNVGQSSITSDFWQGDEAKFLKTFPKGADAVFIDEPEWDKDFKVWRAQINMTITDADDKTPIGAATVEINLTELARRKSLTN